MTYCGCDLCKRARIDNPSTPDAYITTHVSAPILSNSDSIKQRDCTCISLLNGHMNDCPFPGESEK